MSKTLSAKSLKKNYSQKNVVNNIDINLEKGEIVGLLGPNGAGKTTTFYMITGMIRPSSGTICSTGERRERLATNFSRFFSKKELKNFQQFSCRPNVRSTVSTEGKKSKILGFFKISK